MEWTVVLLASAIMGIIGWTQPLRVSLAVIAVWLMGVFTGMRLV
jgi:hypothetical protein